MKSSKIIKNSRTMEESKTLKGNKAVRNLKTLKQFLAEEDGMGTVEVILIIVVLVGLVIIFKNQIGSIIQTLFRKITSQTNQL